MSLERYTNISQIRATPGYSRGMLWNQSDVEELQLTQLTSRPLETPTVEVHIYTPTNEVYLGGGPITDFVYQGDKIYIDYVEVFKKYNIKRGFFKVNVNVHYDIIGSYEYPLLKISEISPDNTELLLTEFSARFEEEEEEENLITTFLNEYSNPFERDFALNFGENQIMKIINFKAFNGEDTLAVKLYEPLNEIEITPLQRVQLIEQISDSWVDNISLDQLATTPPPSRLRGPNFEIETGYTTTTESDFYSWTQLLGSNLNTSQKIIDSYFSGSITGAELGIDYTAFPNFIYYSSAAERVINFKNKLENIEYYNSRIAFLNTTSGSSSGSLSSNITSVRNKRNTVIGSFDTFERWLYNEPTASLFTHAISGSAIAGEGEFFALSPYPKRLVNGIQTLYHSTASISEAWYSDLYTNAVTYDEQNPYTLVKSIPEYIREDANNSEYETFVNMIGHHFDILWSYANSLTHVYVKEEHPKLGIDKDILVDIARSQGWSLANGKQASQLWQYRLGTNQSGSLASTGSITSISDEQITGEVWRRIVNNLPYILKTRGTKQSLDALLNIYGIPKTILSVREYGGPLTADEWPVLTEDRYSYAVDFNSGSSISYKTTFVSSSFGTWWGRPLGSNNVVSPQMREFRFRPAQTSSMLLYSHTLDVFGGDVPSIQIAIEHTGSFSGSGEYGRIHVSHARGISATFPSVASSEWLPLYNGEFWNLYFGYQTTGDHFNTGSNTDTTYKIKVQHASDFIKGKISHTSSIEYTPGFSTHYLAWSPEPTYSETTVWIGGNTGSADTLNVNSFLGLVMGGTPGTFSGSIQEYREWLEFLTNAAFDDHTLNPTSYASGLSATSSYDTLIRHYTLGSETVGYDLSTGGTIISSSHPNQVITDFTTVNPYNTNATTNGFTTPLNNERGNFIPVEETYYIRGASVGATNTRSEKIRLEDNFLVRRLSPTNTSERSSFDNAPLDSNKLGLFYSFADQVNKEIFNHIGRISLDDYIGDPDNEHEFDYEDLKRLSSQYFKKFTNNSDVNSYNRIFSQFDFSIFNQFKQTLAERIDEVTGLLIEPHILERSKVILTKPIQVETPNYDIIINQVPPTASGETIEYSGVIAAAGSSPTGSIQVEYEGLAYILKSTSSVDYCTIETLPVDELNSYTASIDKSNYVRGLIGSVTASISQTYANQDILYNPSFVLSPSQWKPSGSLDSSTWNTLITDINNGSAHISSSIVNNNYSNQIRLLLDTSHQYDTEQTIKLLIHGDSPAALPYTAVLAVTERNNEVNDRIVDILASKTNTLSLNNTLETISFNKILIPKNSYLTCIIQFHNTTGFDRLLTIKQLTPISSINSVCHSPKETIIDSDRVSDIYHRVVYHYSGSTSIADDRLRNWDYAQSESIGLFYSRSLEPARYRDDFYEKTERLYYIGTQLIAPSINAPSTITAIGNTPIIEIYEVNANQLFYNDAPKQRGPGNTLDPGNLTVR